MTPTPAEWLRAQLADGQWHRVSWLSIAAYQAGLSLGDVAAAYDQLADDLDWNHARPARVRLVKARAQQLTIDHGGLR